MNKNFISLCAGILLGVSPLFAVPAKPVLVRVAQPDGTYNPHFQISRESQTKRLNFEPFGKTKRSKIDKRTVQKKHRKNIFLQCFFIALSFGYLTKNH